MNNTECSPDSPSAVDPDLKEFLLAIDEDGGWANDVLLRLFREGRLEAGDISCDRSLNIAIQHGLVKNIQDNGENDYSYQLTQLGLIYCILYLPDREKGFKVKAGDIVTLNHVEYDNYYDLYKVVAVSNHMVAVSLIKDWVRIDSFMDLNKVKIMGLTVQLDEVNHATWDEINEQCRSDEI